MGNIKNTEFIFNLHCQIENHGFVTEHIKYVFQQLLK